METMRVAGEISSSLTTKVHGDKSKYQQVQPDLSFTYKESVVPDLVIDVAWSESDLNLDSRASHYMESEDGPVQTIVGLDMADIYNGSRHAKFSVWKARRYVCVSLLFHNLANVLVLGTPENELQFLLKLLISNIQIPVGISKSGNGRTRFPLQ